MNINEIICKSHSYFFISIDELDLSVTCLLCKSLNKPVELESVNQFLSSTTKSTVQANLLSCNCPYSQNYYDCTNSDKCNKKPIFFCLDCIEATCQYCAYNNHKYHEIDISENILPKFLELSNKYIIGIEEQMKKAKSQSTIKEVITSSNNNNNKLSSKSRKSLESEEKEYIDTVISSGEDLLSDKSKFKSIIENNTSKISTILDNYIKSQKDNLISKVSKNSQVEEYLKLKITNKQDKLNSYENMLKDILVNYTQLSFKSQILFLEENKYALEDLFSYDEKQEETKTEIKDYKNNTKENIKEFNLTVKQLLSNLKLTKQSLTDNIASFVPNEIRNIKKYSYYEKLISNYIHSSSVSLSVNKSIYLSAIGLCCGVKLKSTSKKDVNKVVVNIFRKDISSDNISNKDRRNDDKSIIFDELILSQNIELKYASENSPCPVQTSYLDKSLYLNKYYEYTIEVLFTNENKYQDIWVGKRKEINNNNKEVVINSNYNIEEIEKRLRNNSSQDKKQSSTKNKEDLAVSRLDKELEFKFSISSSHESDLNEITSGIISDLYYSEI